MKEIMAQFSKSLTVVTALAAGIAVLTAFVFPALYSPAVPWLIVLFTAATSFLYYILLKASTGKFSRFTNLFMAGSVLKLLLLLIIITVYLYFNKADAIRFVVSMFILYLAYTFLEVYWLLRINKLHDKP